MARTTAKAGRASSAPPAGLKAQRAFIGAKKDRLGTFDLMIAESFVSAIRDLGYKNNAHAIDELIDNSQQAGATNIHVAFGFTGGSDAKPSELAIIDDGHGMDVEMIRVAMMWGGTHREGDREGFGRFGFGLPSASVSIAREYTVYSWTRDGEGIYAASFGTEALRAGKYRSRDGRTMVPDAVAAKLPDWVSTYIDKSFPGGLPDSGTVVVLRQLDRLLWKTTKVLREKLADHIGVVYRNYLRTLSIAIHERAVEPVDPMFLMSGARFVKGDAEELPPASFEVKDPESGHSLGTVKIRYSHLPPAQFSERYCPAEKKEVNRARTAIRDAYNGLLLLRNGRQIDVVRSLPRAGNWQKSFKNYHAFFKIEIDFPATLDEEFSVTTSKQQVVLSDRMWELLRQHGVPRMMTQLYNRVNGELVALKVSRDEGVATVRASEQVMAEVRKFKARRSEAMPAEREAEAEQYKREHIRERAAAARVPEEVVAQQFETEAQQRKYVVEQESLPGAPFYRVIPRGGQIVLLINKGHRFYTEVYAAYEANLQLRPALEIMLFVMGEAELDANEDRRRFYESERAEWSRVLNTALDRLHELDAGEFEAPGEEALDEAQGATMESATD